MNNEVIGPSLQWYLSQDRLITIKQGQIAALQKKIDNGEGNPKEWNDKKANLEGEIKQTRIDQENTVKQIKEEASKRHYEINWQETAADTNQTVQAKSIPTTAQDRISGTFQTFQTPEPKSVKTIKVPEPGQ